MPRAVLVLVMLACTTAHADLRGAIAVHGSARAYKSSASGEPHRGWGPGVAVQITESNKPTVHGVHLGWHVYDEDNDNGRAHTRFLLLQAHYYVEHRTGRIALGAGIGLDLFHGKHYSIDGNPSYTSKNVLLSANAQLAIEALETAGGTRFGVAVGAGAFPLIDVLGIISGGEADTNWRGGTVSLGVYWQPP